MSVLQTQFQIASQLRMIEDIQERMAAVVDRVRKTPPFPEEERIEAHRVQGCISRVWLVASFNGERCYFRIDADSTLVRGLCTLICEIYDGATPREILAHDANILDLLHLTDHLSPTRRHGLSQVRRAIHEYAETLRHEG